MKCIGIAVHTLTKGEGKNSIPAILLEKWAEARAAGPGRDLRYAGFSSNF
jgi:hypothetical protein